MFMSIDPGLTKSGYVYSFNLSPMHCGILENNELISLLVNTSPNIEKLIIERPVCHKWSGASLSDTAIWTGRFIQASGAPFVLINRQKVRMSLVGKKASDAKIRNYLIENFYPEYTRKNPGIFEGFKEDIWQAYALLITYNKMTGGKMYEEE